MLIQASSADQAYLQNIETEDLFKPYEHKPSTSYTYVSLLL